MLQHEGNREMTMSLANTAIWSLVDNDDAMYGENYRVACDDCATLISEDQCGSHDGLCDRCYDAVHFTCSACGEECHTDDCHATYKDLCEGCGSAKRTEVADELWSEIEDLAGTWSGEETEITNLKKLLAYAKKLK